MHLTRITVYYSTLIVLFPCLKRKKEDNMSDKPTEHPLFEILKQKSLALMAS